MMKSGQEGCESLSKEIWRENLRKPELGWQEIAEWAARFEDCTNPAREFIRRTYNEIFKDFDWPALLRHTFLAYFILVALPFHIFVYWLRTSPDLKKGKKRFCDHLVDDAIPRDLEELGKWFGFYMNPSNEFLRDTWRVLKKALLEVMIISILIGLGLLSFRIVLLIFFSLFMVFLVYFRLKDSLDSSRGKKGFWDHLVGEACLGDLEELGRVTWKEILIAILWRWLLVPTGVANVIRKFQT